MTDRKLVVWERLHRFFRPTIACPRGAIAHDGDCRIFGFNICTCGLIHTIMQEDALTKFPRFEDDWAKHNQTLAALTEKRRG